MAWIRRQARNKKPFLVYLAANAPHVPLWAPQKYIDPYLGKVESRIAKFFGMIASGDENMGRLTALLDEEQRGTVGGGPCAQSCDSTATLSRGAQ